MDTYFPSVYVEHIQPFLVVIVSGIVGGTFGALVGLAIFNLGMMKPFIETARQVKNIQKSYRANIQDVEDLAKAYSTLASKMFEDLSTQVRLEKTTEFIKQSEWFNREGKKE